MRAKGTSCVYRAQGAYPGWVSRPDYSIYPSVHPSMKPPFPITDMILFCLNYSLLYREDMNTAVSIPSISYSVLCSGCLIFTESHENYFIITNSATLCCEMNTLLTRVKNTLKLEHVRTRSCTGQPLALVWFLHHAMGSVRPTQDSMTFSLTLLFVHPLCNCLSLFPTIFVYV